FEIGARHRAANAVEIASDLAADIAAVEIVEPGVGEMLERRGERCLLERRAYLGRLAVEQKRWREAGHVFELGELLGGEAGLARGGRPRPGGQGRRRARADRKAASARHGRWPPPAPPSSRRPQPAR